MFEIGNQVEQKLRDEHDVEFQEVIECFINTSGPYLRDTRETHRTTPPIEWFIAETNEGRRLKVVFIENEGTFTIKTAYEPSTDEERIYAEHIRPSEQRRGRLDRRRVGTRRSGTER